jgi:hypothetical protein
MPLIPFPNVPLYPGVPALPRTALGNPIISIGIGSLASILINSLQAQSQWGIYDQNGNLLGIDNAGSLSIESIISNQITGGGDSVQSTVSVEYNKENKISTFPVEQGGFATYNKVQLPANPVVSLALSGDESDRTQFLAAIESACNSTDLYNVVTPEVTYVNYSLERYSYRRSASRGATLLIVEISLEEVRTISAAFTQATLIQAPQAPDAATQVNNGITQTQAPDQSVLSVGMQKLGISN